MQQILDTFSPGTAFYSTNLAYWLSSEEQVERHIKFVSLVVETELNSQRDERLRLITWGRKSEQ